MKKLKHKRQKTFKKGFDVSDDTIQIFIGDNLINHSVISKGGRILASKMKITIEFFEE